MKKSRFLGHALSALAVTWFVSGAPASAQMPLLIGDILMPESGNRDTEILGTAVAVDESGQWLRLRTATDNHYQRNANMAELLKFDAADTLATFDTTTNLSAEDYRFPAKAPPGWRIWFYDGDPLDRGVYKRELGNTNGSTGRSRLGRSRHASSVGRSTSPAAPRNLAEQRGRARVVQGPFDRRKTGLIGHRARTKPDARRFFEAARREINLIRMRSDLSADGFIVF